MMKGKDAHGEKGKGALAGTRGKGALEGGKGTRRKGEGVCN